MNKIFDILIIGSGSSGGTLAYFLSQSGLSVALIESGKAFSNNNYPANELHSNVNLFWNNASEFNTNNNMLFLRAKVLGGGTTVNQALLDQFPKDVFNQWKDVSGIPFFNSKDFQAPYQIIESNLAIRNFTQKNMNGNAEICSLGCKRAGLKWSFLRRGEKNCDHQNNDCIVCLGGCPRRSKQSTALTFIPLAKQNGVHIFSETTATKVTPLKNGIVSVTIQKINFVEGKQPYITKSEILTRKCILAAGTIGSTKLLLQSGFQNSLPALGTNFFCHPQTMYIGLYKKPIFAYKGAFQTISIDIPKQQKHEFKIENVFIRPIALASMYPYVGIKNHLFMEQLNNMSCLEVAINDTSPGKISLSSQGYLEIHKTKNYTDKKRFKAGTKFIKDILYASGAYEVVKLPLNIGLHLMGGCCLGSDPNTSVVNENFQLWHQPNIYIADSATFPTATGCNPSLTIMAMAVMLAQKILKDMGVKQNFFESEKPLFTDFKAA